MDLGRCASCGSIASAGGFERARELHYGEAEAVETDIPAFGSKVATAEEKLSPATQLALCYLIGAPAA